MKVKVSALTIGLFAAASLTTSLPERSDTELVAAPVTKEKLDLALDLRTNCTSYDFRDPNDLFISLINYRKELRAIEQLPTTGNMLGNAADLQFVFRFQTGEVFVVPSVRCKAPKDKELRPLAIAPLGEVAGFVPLRNFFHGHPDLQDAFDKNPNFGVTAIVRHLDLKSQTIEFNGYKDDRKEPDALKDAEEYFKRKQKEKE